MTSFSKFFSDRTKDLTCRELLHPEYNSCSSFYWYFIRESSVRILKYVGPMFLIPMVANFRNITLKQCKETAEDYFKMSIYSATLVAVAFSLHCISWKVCNGIQYYNVVAIPMLISLLYWVDHLPTKFAKIQCLFANNLLVQTLLRTSDNHTIKLLRESRVVSTVLFMALSSLIMGLTDLTAEQRHRYWYAQNFEQKQSRTDSDGELSDKVVLLRGLIFKQLMKTLKVAVLMSSIKILTKSLQLLRKSVFQFVVFFIKNFDYKLMGFFAMYGTSFQVFNFLLNEVDIKWERYQKSLLAGLLAGTAFYLSPRYFVFTYALTDVVEFSDLLIQIPNTFKISFSSLSVTDDTAVCRTVYSRPEGISQLHHLQLLTRFFLSKVDQNSKATKFLKNVSWLKVFVYISLPTFSHWRVFSPWRVPQIMDKIISIAGVDRLSIGSQNYAKYILGI